MKIEKWIANAIMNKLKKVAKEDSGYDIDVKFDDPISFRFKDGAAKLHINVTASVDANLLMKLMEGMGSD